MKYLFFDTETTGVPQNYKAPVTDTLNWPRLVQLGWIVTDEFGCFVKQRNVIIKPEGFEIPLEAQAVHGISTERALREGHDLLRVLDDFYQDLKQCGRVVGHNVSFDIHIVGAELCRKGMDYTELIQKPWTCTMQSTTDFCALPGRYGYKWPKLIELHRKLFGRDFDGAHDAMADITATKDCYFELRRIGIIKD